MGYKASYVAPIILTGIIAASTFFSENVQARSLPADGPKPTPPLFQQDDLEELVKETKARVTTIIESGYRLIGDNGVKVFDYDSLKDYRIEACSEYLAVFQKTGKDKQGIIQYSDGSLYAIKFPNYKAVTSGDVISKTLIMKETGETDGNTNHGRVSLVNDADRPAYLDRFKDMLSKVLSAFKGT